MKKIFSLFIIVPFVVFSQSEWIEVDSKDFMNTIREFEQTIQLDESYSMETTYDIFKNYSDILPVQSVHGKLTCRNGKELNVSQMGFFMIQDEKYNLTIDTLNQQIIVQKPDSSLFYRKTINDVAAFSEITEAVYKKEVLGKTLYSLELKSGYPYHAIEFEFLSKEIISQIIIYSNQPYRVEDYTQESDKARIVINFKNLKKGIRVSLKDFVETADLIVVKAKEFHAIGKYKDYEVIDLRN